MEDLNLTIIDAIENELQAKVGPIETLKVENYPTLAQFVSVRLYMPLEDIVVDADSERLIEQIGYFNRSAWGVNEVYVELEVSGNIRVEVRSNKTHQERQ